MDLKNNHTLALPLRGRSFICICSRLKYKLFEFSLHEGLIEAFIYLSVTLTYEKYRSSNALISLGFIIFAGT